MNKVNDLSQENTFFLRLITIYCIKIFNFNYKILFSVIALLFIITKVISQEVQICGTIPSFNNRELPQSYPWDLEFIDQFGNVYNVGDMMIEENSVFACSTSGYFSLAFADDITTSTDDFTEGEIETICQVFSDLSDIIVSENSGIAIKFVKKSIGFNLGLAHVQFPSNRCGIEGGMVYDLINSNSGLDELLPGGYFAGVIDINSILPYGANWHTINEDISSTNFNVGSNEYDLYSVVLHEALHMLGFASLINLDGSPVAGFYSTWDSFLFGLDREAFLINPEFDDNCCNNYEFNTTDFPEMPGDLSHSCEQDPFYSDIVFGSDNKASVDGRSGLPQNNGEMHNDLSHLNKDCDNLPYVMHSGLYNGVHRREIQEPELDILCAIGYKLTDPGSSCPSCSVVAVDDGLFLIEGGSLYLKKTDLLENDNYPVDYVIQIDEDCREGSELNISTNFLNGWTIYGAEPGRLYHLCYTLIGCNGDCDQGYFTVLYQLDVDALPPCPAYECNFEDNLFCYGDFESFEPPVWIYGYYSMLDLPACNLLKPGTENSPDMIEENNGNIYVQMYSIQQWGDYNEHIYVKLTQAVQPGCTLQISFDALANYHPTSTIQIFGTNGIPCDISVLPNCSNPSSLGNFHCIEDGIIIEGSDWEGISPVTWVNETNEPINYICIIPISPTDGQTRVGLDNLVITSECDNILSATVDIKSMCIGGIAEVEYTICLQGSNNTPTDISLQVLLPPYPGIELADCDFIDGIATINDLVANGNCAKLSLILNIDHTFSEGNSFLVGLNLVSNNVCYDDIETNIILEECSPNDFCYDYNIQANTIWTVNTNLPQSGVFRKLTVKSGVSLRVESGVVLRFCDGGSLVIEPGAYLKSQGTFTSFSDNMWDGVFVQGIPTVSQLKNCTLYIGSYYCQPQGYFWADEGAIIEHASIAVRNYGPTNYEAGGIINAFKATFRDNVISADFAPYKNFQSNGLPTNSLGSFTQCNFVTTSNYNLPFGFKKFINLFYIDGINIYGSSFSNNKTISPNQAYIKYGVGVDAINSVFGVYGKPTTISPPCQAPCMVVVPSTFNGLGHGIRTSNMFRTRPYDVLNSTFENCYRGITSISAPGGTIVNNNFKLGKLPHNRPYAASIGIEMTSDHPGFEIQENLFERSEEGDIFSIGIRVNNLGTFPNIIRRNNFDMLDIGNEAFGINANNNIIGFTGLRYLCNSNDNFYETGTKILIPNTIFIEDNIFNSQGIPLQNGDYQAAGNTFPPQGYDILQNQTDDPNNINFIDYYYNAQSADQEPLAGNGFVTTTANPNECISDYCAPPCLSNLGIQSRKSDYYYHHTNYLDAISAYDYAIGLGDTTSAMTQKVIAEYSRFEFSRSAYDVVAHLWRDTINYSLDSIISWCGKLDCFGADVMIAGEYFNDGRTTEAITQLESIRTNRNLFLEQEIDLRYLIDELNLLDTQSVFNLNNVDRQYLRTIALSEIGISSGIARTILSFYSEHFGLPYYLADQSIEYRANRDQVDIIQDSTRRDGHLDVFPNPATNEVAVLWDDKSQDVGIINVYNIQGYNVFSGYINSLEHKIMNVEPWAEGIYIIIVNTSEELIYKRFVVQ